MIHFKDWLIDSIYALYGFMIMYIYRKPPKKYLENKDKNPVIVLQGVFNKWGFMKKTADDLSNLGYPVYVFPQLGNNIKKISETAEIVKKFILDKDLKDVVIVGHSKGGLVGKYMMANLDKDKRIKGVVSIASPFHGSNLANYYKFIKPNEFYPQHPTIKELMSHKEVNKKIITINPLKDNIVISYRKSTLEDAFDNMHLNSVGHHKLIFDKEGRQAVIKAVERFSI